MKFVFAFLFAVCLSVQFQARAQYQPLLGSQSTAWKFSGRYSYFNWYINDSVVVAEDTLIGSVVYKRLIGTCYENQTPSSLYFTNDYGFLREDPATGRAWYLGPNNQAPEALVYDMNLSLGDSMQVSWDIPYNAAVDSVYFTSGRKHIRFNYYPPTDTLRQAPQKLTMIEGIGTNYGFNYMGHGSFSMSEEVLLCSYKNQVQVFAHTISEPGYSGCRYDALVYSAEESLESALMLYPNPASEQVLLRLGKAATLPDGARIQLWDLTGRQLRQQPVSGSQQEIPLSVNGLQPGVYLLSVEWEGRSLYRERLVVQ